MSINNKKINGKFGNFELLPQNALLIGDEILVIGDIHLGIESYFVDNGIFFPQKQMKDLKQNIEKIKNKADKIIINGDLKHNFSKFSFKEMKQVENFLEYLKDSFKDVVMIKGNHDNFIDNILKKLKIDISTHVNIDEFYITHGHENIPRKILESRNVVIGHEHPAIRLSDSTGVGEKIPCFLLKKHRKNYIIVLPSFSSLSSGTNVLQLSSENLLTPLMKSQNLDDFEVYGTYENEIFYLSTIKKLREL